jgi:hypothetical protein
VSTGLGVAVLNDASLNRISFMGPPMYLTDIDPPRHYRPEFYNTYWYNATDGTLWVWKQFQLANAWTDVQWMQIAYIYHEVSPMVSRRLNTIREIMNLQ